jgi:predicted Zn-dependent protease with MMP-like domain
VQPISPQDFETLVADAMDAVPAAAAQHFRNVAVVIEDEHPDDPHLLGLYEGVSLVDRDGFGGYSGVLPDRISLYRIPLCLMADDLDDLRNEVRITVMHEFAHHIGIDDERLHELGWD